MKDFFSKHYLVIIALSLPFVFVAGIAVVVAVQTSNIDAQYSFVYAACSQSTSRHNCNAANAYVVNSGTIEERSTDDTSSRTAREADDTPTRLFIHEMPENVSREVTLQDVQQYELSSLTQSPDGYEVEGIRNGSYGVFPFRVPSTYDYYITNGSTQSKLNLSSQINKSRFSSNFHFIGWITN